MRSLEASGVHLLLWLGWLPLAATAQEDAAPLPPAAPAAVFAADAADTLRTNYRVAEALLGEAVLAVLDELPPPPAAVVLVPGDAEQPAALLTTVATHHLQRAGYAVHLDQAPAGTELRVVELRYRVEDLSLTYPVTGRRLGLWTSWIGRQMDLAVTFTVVDAADGRVLTSRRLVRGFQDRVPPRYLASVESDAYPFTTATTQPSTWSRRLEQVVVLGTLVGLVAIYFANTE
ncbi:MAG TPA: hypothetical protein PLL30_08065 [Candidatus Krumholzibacteria bacterium]|nr:hypothetical protein [Candidatus Krumholzibacteria bacterium]HPD71711.1 hypothetical protein [Candidatus Krumholzibacteria bacterium]HRY41356.1 hypothetical protein [Candidatus Krumholzibacteria bacterium]